MSNANDLKTWPHNSVIRLKNVSCPYCGVKLTEDTANKEHVIGRRFVPKGKLDGWWNLIVNSCQPCNTDKADLEDDISAITMQPDALGSFGHDDTTGMSEAVRKAEKSFSRRTKKLIKDSDEQFQISGRLGKSATISREFCFPTPARSRPHIPSCPYAIGRLLLLAHVSEREALWFLVDRWISSVVSCLTFRLGKPYNSWFC